MGRKPNPVIGEYFTRGPKLSDNSNRYPHTCKLCGENFPKGRGEVLHKHITEKCPAITPAERVNAALGFAGLTTTTPTPQQRPQALLGDALANGVGVHDGSPTLAEPWSALQTLAEASRQVEVSEKGHTVTSIPANPALRQLGDRFELQEQFTLDNPPVSYENRSQREKKDVTSVDGQDPLGHLTTEEKMEQLQAAALQPESPANPSNISVAAAAAARVNHALLDPQLTEGSMQPVLTPLNKQTQEPAVAIHSGPARHQPWGEMTYMAHNPTMITDASPVTPPPNRGGVRMQTGNGLSTERRRAAFTPSRRREVQQARKMGACIRCRILRKSCGTNDPCDACAKVSKARFWQIPCIRTRLHNLLTLYSAGLVVVLAQNRVNEAKGAVPTAQNGTSICVTLFQGHASMNLLALMTPRLAQAQEPSTDQNQEGVLQILMIDSEYEDLPGLMEEYMKGLLPTLIEHESSRFMQVVLSTARQLPSATGGILKRAIELWGLVEILERERYWVIHEQRPGEKEPRPLENIPGRTQDIYNLITFQLSAAAERKANSVSEDLLGAMQRDLQSSKVAIAFDMYLAVLILLNCIEKSTWAIKVWELPTFRPGWPLQVPPESFTSQGHDLGSILKMLLSLRKAHPSTVRGNNGKLSVVDTTDEQLSRFFRELDLDYDEVLAKHEHCEFAPENSRSLQFYFCGHVLLPPKQADEGASSGAQQSPVPLTPTQ